MGIDSCANCSATDSQFLEFLTLGFDELAGFFEGFFVAVKFLSQTNWDGILMVCAANLHGFGMFFGNFF